jgi:CubicO group peptidase (beta-lactamase class C family)
MNPVRPVLFVLAVALSCAKPGMCAQGASTQTQQHDTETEQLTAHGHSFPLPRGWSLRVDGDSRWLGAPDSDSVIALFDLQAPNGEAAINLALHRYAPKHAWPRAGFIDRPARNGWASIRVLAFDVPASAKRAFNAHALRHGEGWTVVIIDLDETVAEKRDAEVGRILGRLWPKGYRPETLAGKPVLPLSGARAATLASFVETARKRLRVPGAAIGLVQDGEIVLARGFGVRRVGTEDMVDADTRFLIASNTKPLTTLMLAKLVDAGKFGWDTPVTEVLPGFKLADPALTRQLRMRHLVCACTGLSRQDMEWVFESERLTPAKVIELIATMQPTGALGEFYQYSNLLAGAAGYAGGHAFDPRAELGAAYDRAMQRLVFDPLGMRATTFDFEAGQRGNFAAPHATTIDGDVVAVPMQLNASMRPSRPDGGAFSNVSDLLRYVKMELAQGKLDNGQPYIAAKTLLERRVQQVVRGDAQGYGMGLKLDYRKGIIMLHHGGIAFGSVSDVMWFPDHGVGAVILTNADDGGVTLRALFRQRLIELMFDAEAQAERDLHAQAKRTEDAARLFRQRLDVPASALHVDRLARRYRSPQLGDLRVMRKRDVLWFDFGAWRSEVATRVDADGVVSFVTISPSVTGYEFAVEDADAQVLVLRDAQREYRFVANANANVGSAVDSR